MLKRKTAERSELERWDEPADADRALSKRRQRDGLLHVESFGSNPGGLRMAVYLPKALRARAPLVVALHGSGEGADFMALDAGWAGAAERHGFALLLPEQAPENNADRAFNWFLAPDTRRDRGEAKSIRQMVEHCLNAYDVDPDRIFITGFASGGAMTSAMLAAYPEIFAAGAIIAGVPYGVAAGAEQARDSLLNPGSRPPRQWGYAVRSATAHKGRWPRISVWHGSTDTHVSPANSGEIIKQWTDLHGLPLYPSEARISDRHEHRIWREPGGEVLVESHAVIGMGHAIPADRSGDAAASGSAAATIADLGISASELICRFWKLTPAEATGAAERTSGASEPLRARSGLPRSAARPPH